ncbi:loganic acid O-methyltransferase-like [Cornus florida]|uniref:loganic acid O-methyltransferase-like n=1 Tax=Cornus florida TaxID=4283 RepID=UPI00289C9E8B|nr:loganic acid O-methyltransferase-like [Cornus florida]
MIHESIAEKLDIEKFSPTSNTFRIADLGCSVGPNTYIAMQNIIEAVEEKYKSKGLESQLPEFQVFFNDHVTSDFNTLFTFLPPERRYFATGVPGSFYGRLFPKSCIHIMHASYALQWLSKVPEEVADKDSAAWNKGRIYYSSAPVEVANAYAAQYAKDMDNFLNNRAKEIVAGGMLLLIMISNPDGIHRSQMGCGVMYDKVGSSLVDMAKEGLISEAQVDSFNLPVYTASPKEVICLVERNGCFGIERMMTTHPQLRNDDNVDEQICSMSMRAALEGLITEHFGSEIIDELFDRFHKEVAGFNLMDSRHKKGILLLLALKRK